MGEPNNPCFKPSSPYLTWTTTTSSTTTQEPSTDFFILPASGAPCPSIVFDTEDNRWEYPEIPLTEKNTFTCLSPNYNPSPCVIEIDKYIRVADIDIVLNPCKRYKLTLTDKPSWVPRNVASNVNWIDITCSGNGNVVVALDYTNGRAYISLNSGLTWDLRLDPNIVNLRPISCAISFDGSKIAIASQNGPIYISNDYGQTWVAREMTRNWKGISGSSDGTKLVAIVNGGQIYTSINSGLTWTPRASNSAWQCVISSSDGTKLVAADTTNIYTSTNSGISWILRTVGNVGFEFWQTVTGSNDGSILFALSNPVGPSLGLIYKSSNSGITWTVLPFSLEITDIASSSDGNILIASVTGGKVYISEDSGVTWSPSENNRSWTNVAISSGGNKLFASVLLENIYTLLG